MTARKLSDLVAKARRDPYELEMPDGTVVSVPQPTITRWREACEGDGIGAVLLALGVTDAEAAAVNAVTEAGPFGGESAVVADMRIYFQLGN